MQGGGGRSLRSPHLWGVLSLQGIAVAPDSVFTYAAPYTHSGVREFRKVGESTKNPLGSEELRCTQPLRMRAVRVREALKRSMPAYPSASLHRALATPSSRTYAPGAKCARRTLRAGLRCLRTIRLPTVTATVLGVKVLNGPPAHGARSATQKGQSRSFDGPHSREHTAPHPTSRALATSVTPASCRPASRMGWGSTPGGRRGSGPLPGTCAKRAALPPPGSG